MAFDTQPDRSVNSYKGKGEWGRKCEFSKEFSVRILYGREIGFQTFECWIKIQGFMDNYCNKLVRQN